MTNKNVEKRTLPKSKAKTKSQVSPPINYIRWSFHCLHFFITYGLYGVLLGILVHHCLSIGLTTLNLSFILGAWPLGNLLAMGLIPFILKISHAKYFLLVGGIHAISISSLYFTGNKMWTMLIGGTFALLISGAMHFLLANRNSALLTVVVHGDTNKVIQSIGVFTNMGWSLGGYVGTALYDNFGFAYTMLSCGICSSFFNFVMMKMAKIPVDSVENREESSTSGQSSGEGTSNDMTNKEVYLLHFRKELLIIAWMTIIVAGSCMGFIEGYMVEFFISKYHKDIQMGGIILAISAMFPPLMSFIFGRIFDRYPGLESKVLISALIVKGCALLLAGPVSTTKSIQVDLALSITGMMILGCASGVAEISTFTTGTNILKAVVSSEMAVSTIINIWSMAYFGGAFVGPIIGGALLQHWEYGAVFACWSPAFFIEVLIITVFLCKFS